jgi:hypothetical protein
MAKFSESIKFEIDRKTGIANFRLDASENERQQLIVQMANSRSKEEHIRFGAALVPPIEMAVPYVEMYNIFLETLTYGDLEDNRLPVEKDVVGIGWNTHADAEVLFVRPGYQFTRPEFEEWDTGVELSWRTARKAGWNVMDRAMRKAVEALARLRDAQKLNALNVAVESISGHVPAVAGGKLTKASVDSIVKSSASMGFPITRALTNPGTLMDMAAGAGWTWGSEGYKIPESVAQELLTTLSYGNYGGLTWNANPHHPVDVVWFAGPADQTGYHQMRGKMSTASDVDIVRKVDLHTIMDAEHAMYIANAYRLWRLTITS